MTNDSSEQSAVYSFGDTDLVAQRLRVVARIFDSASEDFVSGALAFRPRLILDLGCGPGFTTRLLLRAASPERAVGVDRSESFLEQARAGAKSAESYVAGDVAEPLAFFGGEPPDLVYLRLLASHLPEPEREISRWLTELAPGGLLLAEEVESIATDIGTFERYLGIVAGMLDHHGNELYVGPKLAAANWGDDVCVEVNRVVEVSPDAALSARMFSMNLRGWRHDPYIAATCTQRELDLLAGELEEMAGKASAGDITWQIRQISLRRQRATMHS